MKKLLFAVAAMVIGVTTMSAEERVIAQSQLPTAAQSFIAKHYPDAKVSIATEEKEFFATDYKVILTSGVKIEFDKSGKWQDVECKRNSAVPAAIIPAAISQYVAAHFPDSKVLKIDRNRRDTEVELESGVELKFNSKGALVEFES